MKETNFIIDEKGLIFNIQKFSVHDGPGIRTTVFLKGCPLRCLWCSNPESQNFYPELMARDINCRGCGSCVRVCPQGAITLAAGAGRVIDRTKCDNCLRCVDACMYDSLKQCGQYMKVSQVLDEVSQDVAFYNNSGGGVTISGGEPLSQPSFAARLLQACKKAQLHTALETTGAAPAKVMQSVLPFTDLVLFDVKHLDPEKHYKMTGIRNSLIQDNLREAARTAEVWLRVPLIAGFNASEGHIRNIAALARDIGAKRISLLPYHEGGKTKSAQLGRAYLFPDGKPPGEKHIRKLQRIIEDAGLTASVSA